jgi:hypothetical protein
MVLLKMATGLFYRRLIEVTTPAEELGFVGGFLDTSIAPQHMLHELPMRRKLLVTHLTSVGFRGYRAGSIWMLHIQRLLLACR